MPSERLAKRIIACLDVDAGRVVKGIQFQQLRDAGDPAELARAHAPGRGRRDRAARHYRHPRWPQDAAGNRAPHRARTVYSVHRGRRDSHAGRCGAVFDAGADKVSINSAARRRSSSDQEIARALARRRWSSRSMRRRGTGRADAARSMYPAGATATGKKRCRGRAKPSTRRGGDPADFDGSRRHRRRL